MWAAVAAAETAAALASTQIYGLETNGRPRGASRSGAVARRGGVATDVIRLRALAREIVSPVSGDGARDCLSLGGAGEIVSEERERE